MLLHRTSPMELHYEPQTDTLTIVWPDMQDAAPAEIEATFGLITESIKHYFITRLLIDSRKATYVPDREVHYQAGRRFVDALRGTGLRKVARVQSGSAERERQTAEVSERLLADNPLELQFRTFPDLESAQNWLQTD